MEPTVRFENVSKIYRLGSGQTSLREALTGVPKRLLGHGRAPSASELAALNGVSFEIGRGESVGLIGPNGSGKTTSLKLISNITRATRGQVWTRGRVSALIELGAGFHPDLTGRENVYFNAAVLGMRAHEVAERFDAIVDFSGLERFLDTPVKRYSSGMYCRLGFAVAAHVNPDILLVDEVLAVGDAAFQAKCLKRMSDLRASGTTILFVTHNLGYLQRLCNRAIFLYRGDIVKDGSVSDVVHVYRDHAAYSESVQRENPDCAVEAPDTQQTVSPVTITDVYYSRNGQRVEQAQTGAPLTVHVGYRATQPVQNVNVEVWLYGLDGTEYASFATLWDDVETLGLQGSGEISLQIDPVCLMPGTYFVNVAFSDRDGLSKYDMHWERHRVAVLSGPVTYGMFYLPHHWNLTGVGSTAGIGG